MKKPSRCAIILSLLITTLLFFEVKDTISGKKDLFIARWFSWLFFSNAAYAAKIEVKPYLLNDEQAAELLLHPNKEIQQPPQKDLYLKNVNLVLRISNHGSTGPWGTLAYSINRGDHWFKIDIKEIPPPNSKKEIYDYVIPLGIVILFDDNEPPKNVLWKWINIYTKF